MIHIKQPERIWLAQAGLAGRCPDDVISKIQSVLKLFGLGGALVMALAVASLISSFTRTTRAMMAIFPVVRTSSAVLAGMAFAVVTRGPRQDVYNILWAVVFGFATLNILSLATRRMEPGRRRMSFGELMAVMVVLVSVFLLGWEMLNVFHILPIKLKH